MERSDKYSEVAASEASACSAHIGDLKVMTVVPSERRGIVGLNCLGDSSFFIMSTIWKRAMSPQLGGNKLQRDRSQMLISGKKC